MLASLPDRRNETKLFYIGGLNSQTYQQAGDVEVYDVETETWLPYMDLPTEAGVGFPSSPDYGCLVVDLAVGQAVFSTLIGRGMSRLGSHWSRGS